MFRAGVKCVDVMREGVHVTIGAQSGPFFQVVTALDADGMSTERVDAGVVAPSIFIPDEVARALLDALSAHYGGASDVRQLRRDYEHERSRVDLLVRSLIRGALDD